MLRINVYRYNEEDGSRVLDGYFDADKAEAFKEDAEWNGSNHISVHTRSQHHHQMLYRTAGGRWVLHGWSNWQGSTPSYEFIDDTRAREWLLINHDDAVIEKHFGVIEEERGPGRPEIGPRSEVRFPGATLERLDVQAGILGIKRPDLIRRYVEQGLDQDKVSAEVAA
jgi:hypothetical protein